MIDLQNIFLLDEEFERLNSYYQEHNRHEIRQRAHMIILRTKSYTPSYIADILNRGDYYVIVYVKAWYYFKEDGLFDDDFEGLIEKIEKLENYKYD